MPCFPASRAAFFCSSLNLLMVLLCEVFEKCHGGGVRDDEFRVVHPRERPASALGIDGLDGQRHGIGGSRRPVDVISVSCHLHQPRPYLGGLPVLAHAGNRGHRCRPRLRGGHPKRSGLRRHRGRAHRPMGRPLTDPRSRPPVRGWPLRSAVV